MLILARKAELDSDTVLIGERSRIVLIGSSETSALFGFKFPDEIPIARQGNIASREPDPPRVSGKMYILTMRQEDIVRIGDEITFVVWAIKTNEAVLGIHAPSEIRVDRAELRLRPDYVEGRKIPGPPERS